MKLPAVMNLIEESMNPYTGDSGRFTGQVQYTLHLRDGGISKVEQFVKQNLSITKVLPKSNNHGILSNDSTTGHLPTASAPSNDPATLP